MKEKFALLFTVFCVCVSSLLSAQGSQKLVSLDAAFTAASTDVSSRVAGKTEVAVVSIESPLSGVSDFLTGELTTYLVRGGKFTVLERGAALKAVNAEQQFQMSGMVSDESAVGIGHYLGAKVVLTGSFSRFESFSQLRLRAIDVRTKQILTLYTARIQPNDLVLAGVMKPLDNVKQQAITENALTHLNQGEDSLREGRLDRAIRELDMALAINSEIANGYFFRAVAYYYKGDIDRTLTDLNQAIKLNPIHAEAYSNRGVVHFFKKDLDRAIADYNEAIRLNPNFVEAYSNRGVVYRNKGDWDRAIADYNEAIRLDPNNATAYNNRGVAYRNKDDTDHAIADYNKALTIKPDYTDALDNRGFAYYKKGDYDRAIADYTAYISIKPDNATTLQNRGNAYYRKGDYDRAIADFSASLRISPDNASALNSRAAAYYNKGDYDRAIADWEAVLRINPNYPNVKQNLDALRQMKGNNGSGRE